MAEEGFSDNEVTLHEAHEFDEWLGKDGDDVRAKHLALTAECDSLRWHGPRYEAEIIEEDFELVKLEQELAEIVLSIGPLKEAREAQLALLLDQMTLITTEIEAKHNDNMTKLIEDTEKQTQAMFAASAARDNETKAALEREIKELEDELKALPQRQQSRIDNMRRIKQQRRRLGIELLSQEMASLDNAIAKMDTSIKQNETKYKRMLAKIMMAEDEVFNLEQLLLAVQREHESQQNELQQLKEGLKEKKQYIGQTKVKISDTGNEIDSLESEIAKLNDLLMALELKRRELHNELQEIRGNIRVFCRVRPQDGAQFKYSVRPAYEEGSEMLAITDGVKNVEYSFDRVFMPEAQNLEIFDEIWQLVQLLMDGYNVCVFAYGQTGLGKTYTMSHGSDGMIPLSLERIFQHIDEISPQGWQYKISGQVLEIYNDNIVDLLVKNDTAKHDIKHDDVLGVTTVTNLTTMPIALVAEARQLIQLSNRHRLVGLTKMNERSLRSHLVFMLHLEGENIKTGERLRGTLNLVDLAGSERLNQSQARGERLKETQAINKLLLSLAQVISALHRPGGHVPYRNCKLTYLLKNSLGGNSKTLMFVNVSPKSVNFSELANSLRFATEVNSTKLASPKKRLTA